ncbi:MAG: ankyrin repeat domain-containing protein [Rhodospirillaceae bacterium]
MSKLFDAAASGDLDEVKRLIAKGADVNAISKGGGTLLHWAADGGHVEIAMFLIAKGADVNAGNKVSGTPLHCAAASGHITVAKFLVTNGADVNAVNHFGSTPLHSAAWQGHAEFTEFLVAEDADENAVNQDGITPLQYAALRGHTAIVDFLRHPKAAQPKTDDRRDAVLALLAEDDTLRSRLGIKADLEFGPEFDVERLLRCAVKKRASADPTLEADVEVGIQFHMQAVKLIDEPPEPKFQPSTPK